MELGEKLRQARLEAGLSQKALCEGEITRNMLSLIENGAASPSMKTLQFLAGRLGKPVGYFLDDAMPTSPNAQRILRARRCYDGGDWAGVLQALEDYAAQDAVFDREKSLLLSISCLNLAEEAIRERRLPYARELLGKVENCVYGGDWIRRRKLLLLGSLGSDRISHALPSLDEELILRGREALEAGDLPRAARLLDAAEGRDPRWHLLRGRVFSAQEDYREAAGQFLLAEAAYPKETVPQLEICFRELGDYEKAYLYACRRRSF